MCSTPLFFEFLEYEDPDDFGDKAPSAEYSKLEGEKSRIFGGFNLVGDNISELADNPSKDVSNVIRCSFIDEASTFDDEPMFL